MKTFYAGERFNEWWIEGENIEVAGNKKSEQFFWDNWDLGRVD